MIADVISLTMAGFHFWSGAYAASLRRKPASRILRRFNTRRYLLGARRRI
jgi:hypothetical protein